MLISVNRKWMDLHNQFDLSCHAILFLVIHARWWNARPCPSQVFPPQVALQSPPGCMCASSLEGRFNSEMQPSHTYLHMPLCGAHDIPCVRKCTKSRWSIPYAKLLPLICLPPFSLSICVALYLSPVFPFLSFTLSVSVNNLRVCCGEAISAHVAIDWLSS